MKSAPARGDEKRRTTRDWPVSSCHTCCHPSSVMEMWVCECVCEWVRGWVQTNPLTVLFSLWFTGTPGVQKVCTNCVKNEWSTSNLTAWTQTDADSRLIQTKKRIEKQNTHTAALAYKNKTGPIKSRTKSFHSSAAPLDVGGVYSGWLWCAERVCSYSPRQRGMHQSQASERVAMDFTIAPHGCVYLYL